MTVRDWQDLDAQARAIVWLAWMQSRIRREIDAPWSVFRHEFNTKLEAEHWSRVISDLAARRERGEWPLPPDPPYPLSDPGFRVR